MTYLPKPSAQHPKAKVNAIGLSRRDYEGALSTLCAGCGHDSVTAAIVQSFFELAIPPYQVGKMSGIGCSSKTPGYFLSQAHGFNAVHGRMPSVTTGANAAHRDMIYIGISGDGDTGSIGIGQFVHAVRRRVNMLYIIENNGVYGLTKGQFSATADFGAKNKSGEANPYQGIDPVLLALQLGAGFVARSFSGDKSQLVPLIKAGLKYPGFALIDVISPCVTFNNHEGSTRSYDHARHWSEDVTAVDFVPERAEIQVAIPEGAVQDIALHDGSVLRLKKLQKDFDYLDPMAAMQYVESHRRKGNIVTGLLHVKPQVGDMHEILRTVQKPLRDLAYEELCPGAKGLAEVNARHR